MTAYLLDTNHTSPLVTIGHPLRNRILQQRQSGDTFALIPPIVHETLFGIASIPRAQANLREWEFLKDTFIYYAIDTLDAQRSSMLRLGLRQQGWQLGIIDAFLAAVALRYDCTILTKDKDF